MRTTSSENSCFDRARIRLMSCDEPSVIEGVSQWATKRIVRTGFEVVMTRANCYTRDLYPAFRFFADNYPHQAPTMRKALQLSIEPSPRPADTIHVIEKLGSWLHRELCSEYGAERIGQLLDSLHD